MNIRCHLQLDAIDICNMLRSLKNLKRLNLSHTKANIDVAKLIASNCLKLEYLNLENCLQMFEYCIELIVNNLSQTIQYLNFDNIKLSQELIERILLTFKSLKYFHANNLADVVNKLYLDTITGVIKANSNQFILSSFYIDSDSILKPELMNSINELCPELRSLQINCTGTRASLSNLSNFKYLTELLIANQDCMISFQFEGYLLQALKDTIGKQLKSLHLIHLIDVNLRSIVRYCPNLIKLIIGKLNLNHFIIQN